MKMHVLFVVAWWPTEKEPLNGIFIKEHALAISKYAKVTVVHLKNIEKSNSWSHFPSKLIQDKTILSDNLQVFSYEAFFRIRKFGILEWQITKLIKNLIKQFADNNHPIDIIHLNILHFFLPSHILKNSSIFKKPIVLTEHSTFIHTEINYLPENEIEIRKNKLREMLNNSLLKAVLPVSKQLGEIFNREYQTPLKKIVTIANVANDCFFETTREKFNSKDKILVFAAATWQDSKDPLLFFNMLKLLQANNKETYASLQINWAGSGKYMEDVKLFVQKELSDLNINFLGRIDKPIIAKHMSQSHFLVHPTKAENLPCIIIESLCMGLPVLTADVNGCEELINDSNGILYKAGSINDLYLKFLKMISTFDNFSFEKIANEAKERYSAGAIGQKILDVYKTII